MPSGVFPLSEHEFSTTINNLIASIESLEAAINTLRADFRAHDHGDTASYVQGAITIRSSAATFTGTETSAVATCDAPNELPVAPA